LAEIADKYCEKGAKVYIEGELQTNKYKDKTTGEKKYSTQVVVSGFNNVFQMVSGKGKDTTTVAIVAMLVVVIFFIVFFIFISCI
jgi:single-stranded DNA-binding protein